MSNPEGYAYALNKPAQLEMLPFYNNVFEYTITAISSKPGEFPFGYYFGSDRVEADKMFIHYINECKNGKFKNVVLKHNGKIVSQWGEVANEFE